MNGSIPPPYRVLVYAWTESARRPTAGARTLLCRALAEWGFSGERISDLILAASELVANATEHAAGPYELWLQRNADEVTCEVHDHDPRVPVLPASPVTGLFVPDPRRRGGGLDALSLLHPSAVAGCRSSGTCQRGVGVFGFPVMGRRSPGSGWCLKIARKQNMRDDSRWDR